MAPHPDLAAEQAYLDRAYDYLEASREAATRLSSMVEVGRGGTEQARFERDVIWDTMLHRLSQLHLGDASLCFGRIDAEDDPTPYYIGRIAVSDEHQEPVIVDWRAPVAEPFYRATGRHPMGLARRRHFATRGRVAARHRGRAVRRRRRRPRAAAVGPGGQRHLRPRRAHLGARDARARASSATSSPPSRASRTRSSGPSCPACWSCRADPAPARRSWRCTAPPTCSTRYRFPLEGQGVLVVGPNRLFLGYIEQVLPSLGEAGVELAVLADLVRRRGRPGPRRAASPPGSRATCAWSRCCAGPCATASARCATTWWSATA